MAAQLAQVNVARLRAPIDSTDVEGFLAAVDPIGRLAETSHGFVWRLRSGHGNGLITRADDGATTVVNLSVWESYEALHAFVYWSLHGGFVKRRSEWFLPTPQPSTALWWVAGGERPTVEDALRRLAVLRTYGPSPKAFSQRRRFGADGRTVGRR